MMKYLLTVAFGAIFLWNQALAVAANVWHLPAVLESSIATTMRDPLYENQATNTAVYQGFFKNGGVGGDQNGGQLYFRTISRGGTPTAWASVALGFHSNVGLNQYWKASIPTATMAATDVIEYYIKVTFSGAAPESTYLYGADSGGSATVDEAVALAKPFSIRNRPAWIYHANDRTVGTEDISLLLKSGYIGADSSADSRWSTNGAIYYTTNGNAPQGSLGVAGDVDTKAVAMAYVMPIADASGNGNAMQWQGTLRGIMNSLPLGATLRYKMGMWHSSTLEEKFAEHGTSGDDNKIFSYQNGVVGEPVLTINGLSGNYTTSKVFVDEIAGDSVPLAIVFQPGRPNVVAVEIFSNLNRRDRAQNDANSDGYPDGVSVPNGEALVAGDDSQYNKAYTMSHSGGGVYTLTLPAQKTGAYRLTARWKELGDTQWRWYTNSAANRRDHAITVSPKDARDMVLYEVNVLNIEASGDTFATRSTLEDMHNAVGAPHEGSNRWDLEYVNSLGVNWLWFQPIHPCGFDGREPVNGYGSGSALYDPGSPYAVKNFFEINPIFSKNFSGNPLNPSDMLNAGNRAEAMTAWQNFVAAADAKKISIMLDAPFNHTAFDCELGQVGVDLFKPDGASWSATDEIRNRESRFYSLEGNYGNRASSSANIAAGPDRYDFGKWNDVKDVFFGRYDALVENNSSPENSSFTSEGDWFDQDDSDWTNNDFVQGGVAKNTTRQVWQYFARYAVHWLEKTRPVGQNRNSSTEAGLSNAQRYEWDARGIDGNRCDFGQGLPPQAWEYIINVARSYKWNFVMMAESLDGGAVTYRSNRHFDVLNENIVFPLQSATNKQNYRDIYESRRNAYGQGLVLANTTSHDEENYTDPWQALIRMGVTASLDGVPMIFPGQELGISRTFGYDHYETNFGKQIAHFKRFNSMMPVWNNNDYGNDQLFPVYAGMIQARKGSPALRSSNRWFLNGNGGEDGNPLIHAVAKYQQAQQSPAKQDVVLAFANLDRGEVQSDQYVVPSTLATLLGIKSSRSYNVKNLAAYENAANGTSGRRDAWLWTGGGLTGTQLTSTGIFVSLAKVPTSGSSNASPGDWATAPFEAQYLKLYDVTPPPSPTPLSSSYALGNNGTFTWSPLLGPDDVISHYLVSIGTSVGGNQLVADATVSSPSYSFTGSLGVVYYASVKAVSAAGISSSVGVSDAGSPNVGSASSPLILLDPEADQDGDGVLNLDENTAGTDPLLPASKLAITGIVKNGNDVTLQFSSVVGRHYRMETSTTLTPGSWTFITADTVATTTTTQLIHLGGGIEAKRFYRIRVSANAIE